MATTIATIGASIVLVLALILMMIAACTVTKPSDDVFNEEKLGKAIRYLALVILLCLIIITTLITRE